MRILSMNADDPKGHMYNFQGQCVRYQCPACWQAKVDEFRKLCEARGASA